MDKITQNYRKLELEKVKTRYNEFKTKIKIIKPNGETKWLDIDNPEFDAISKILKGESVVYISDDAKKIQKFEDDDLGTPGLSFIDDDFEGQPGLAI